MHHLVGWIEHYGLIFIFLNVLIQQSGVPLPVYPTLIVTGALIGRGHDSAAVLILVASSAALIADVAWYSAGRRFGRPILRALCRISLSPDSCVSQTESIYARWGAPSLMVAKFIPGFAAVATALSGAIRTPLARFLVFDAIGAALWSGVAIGIGALFRNTIDSLLDTLNALGQIGIGLVLACFVLFVLFKWWQRRRFYAELRMARISVDELHNLLDSEATPVILDVRSAMAQERDGRIPGALAINDHNMDAVIASLSELGEVVVYCACPNEASAAVIAKRLMQRGFTRVRPLHGGIDAWRDAGYAIERRPFDPEQA